MRRKKSGLQSGQEGWLVLIIKPGFENVFLSRIMIDSPDLMMTSESTWFEYENVLINLVFDSLLSIYDVILGDGKLMTS